jgi:hypothetical protein
MHNYIIIYQILKHGKVTSTAVSQIAYSYYPTAVRFVKERVQYAESNHLHSYTNPYEGVWECSDNRYTIKELTVQ